MRDDRGQQAQRDWSDAQRFRAVHTARWRDAPRAFVRWCVIVAACIVAACALVWILRDNPRGAAASALVLLLAQWLLASYLLPVVGAPTIARRRRICPACLYDLADVPRADDGRTVCPECGGAWLLPRGDG